jgi:hypothetical protein
MARAHRVPTAVGRVGFKDALRASGRIAPTRSLKLPFEAVDVRDIDGPVPQHDISGERKCAFKPFNYDQVGIISPRLALTGIHPSGLVRWDRASDLLGA